MQLDDYDSSIEVILGKEFTYETALIFFETKYPQLYNELQNIHIPDAVELIKEISGLDLLCSDKWIENKNVRIILGYCLGFDNEAIDIQCDGSYGLNSCTSFGIAFANAIKQFDNDFKLYVGITMWG